MANEILKESNVGSNLWEKNPEPEYTDDSGKSKEHSYPISPEEIQRIYVEEEDRLAFRVGVNLITLSLIAVGIYFLVRYFMANS